MTLGEIGGRPRVRGWSIENTLTCDPVALGEVGGRPRVRGWSALLAWENRDWTSIFTPASWLTPATTCRQSEHFNRMLGMMSDNRTNKGKACYVKHCTCSLPVIHKRFSLLIWLNEIVRYDAT